MFKLFRSNNRVYAELVERLTQDAKTRVAADGVATFKITRDDSLRALFSQPAMLLSLYNDMQNRLGDGYTVRVRNYDGVTVTVQPS